MMKHKNKAKDDLNLLISRGSRHFAVIHEEHCISISFITPTTNKLVNDLAISYKNF